MSRDKLSTLQEEVQIEPLCIGVWRASCRTELFDTLGETTGTMMRDSGALERELHQMETAARCFGIVSEIKAKVLAAMQPDDVRVDQEP